MLLVTLYLQTLVNQLVSTLQNVTLQLKRLGVQWAVIGGIALWRMKAKEH